MCKFHIANMDKAKGFALIILMPTFYSFLKHRPCLHRPRNFYDTHKGPLLLETYEIACEKSIQQMQC